MKNPLSFPQSLKNHLTLLGVAQSLGQGQGGVEEAPGYLREKGLRDFLQESFETFVDVGDLKSPPRDEWVQWENQLLRNPWSTSFFCQDLAQYITQVMTSETFPLIIGGDHSQAIGVIQGLERMKRGRKILWVDAHADINTMNSSPSGNLHGMPLSVLLGLERKNPYFQWVKDFIDPQNIVLLGIREVDQGEWKILEEKKIRYYTAQDLKVRGMDQVMDEAMDYLLGGGNMDLHVELDVDAFDPQDMVPTGTLAKDGPRSSDMLVLADHLRHIPLSSLEVVEFNPRLGNPQEREQGTQNLMNFFRHLFCRPYPQCLQGNNVQSFEIRR